MGLFIKVHNIGILTFHLKKQVIILFAHQKYFLAVFLSFADFVFKLTHNTVNFFSALIPYATLL
ncbi:hypothetical protein CW304_08710 [Bacillus sp. UFRGS-B20]|nr:hypothetical protein CW304_08710 [Bacillus sp. UFRGS-B20]